MSFVRRSAPTALGLAFALASVAAAATQLAAQKISRLGEYSGYSEPIYDSSVRSSQYVTMRDGTKLAVDIIRPTRNGQVHTDPLPVIWTHHRYTRARVRNDTLYTILDWMPYLPRVMSHGYVVAAVDTRGGGASFGTQQGFFGREEAGDAYEITEWLAAQPWSDGNIGMYGRSYLGITQYFAASEAPPHLKAIFPEMASFEWYPFIYPGGVYRNDFLQKWNYLTSNLDRATLFDWYSFMMGPVARVDEDTDGKMLRAAIAGHEANRDMVELFSLATYRNSVDPILRAPIHIERSPATYLKEIEASGVPVYHLAGWFDMFPRDVFQWYNNLSNPQKVVVGPWFHTDRNRLDLGLEHLRWYDYWLKGIDNGIMDEPPVHYWVMGAPEGEAWRGASEWPLPEQQLTDFYFAGGASGTVASANDGVLAPRGPTSDQGYDEYVVDYAATSGLGNRWANGYGGPIGYPDLTENDEKGLTYTTAPLTTDTEVTGHPVIHLWVTATTDDADFFVYLEEIDGEGKSNYVTEGTLRASHRKLTTPPFNNMGLPYPRSFEEDIEPLPDHPVELVFDLYPTSNVFDAGHRIRITITGADTDNTLTPRHSPPPTVRVYRNRNGASYITLPIVRRVS